jgi:alpha-glucosidase (family GH31 glycosyl hydrolase)
LLTRLAVWRALVFQWPTDRTAAAVDQQVLIGSAILLTPVTTQGPARRFLFGLSLSQSII